MPPLSELDQVMIRHAAQRGVVLMDDGRTARLVSWRGRRRRQRHPMYARVQYSLGSEATVSIDKVVAYEDPMGVMVPLPPPSGRPS